MVPDDNAIQGRDDLGPVYMFDFTTCPRNSVSAGLCRATTLRGVDQGDEGMICFKQFHRAALVPIFPLVLVPTTSVAQ